MIRERVALFGSFNAPLTVSLWKARYLEAEFWADDYLVLVVSVDEV